jgi:hypothetical protein
MADSTPLEVKPLHKRNPDELDPEQRLGVLRMWIVSGFELPQEWRQYLIGTLHAASQGESIDRLWGLAPAPGQRSLKTQRITAQRDTALRKAWRRLEGTPWQRSRELAHRIRRYSATGWPRDRERGTPASDDEIRVCLFRAMSCGDVPGSADQVHRICTRTN